MRIECPECPAAYDVVPADRPRRSKCRKCGAVLVIPAAGTTPEEEAPPGPPLAPPPADPRAERAARRRAEAPPRPALAVVVACVSFAMTLVYVPVTGWIGLGAGADVAGQSSSVAAGLGFLLAVVAVLGVGLVAGGVGLLLHKTWGWWTAMFMYGFFLLFYLKMSWLIFSINWDHPRAMEAALRIGWQRGLPVVVSLVMLTLLLLPRMRVAFAVRPQRVTRRRVAPRLPS